MTRRVWRWQHCCINPVAAADLANALMCVVCRGARRLCATRVRGGMQWQESVRAVSLVAAPHPPAADGLQTEPFFDRTPPHARVSAEPDARAKTAEAWV
jgi:hypothetical protein